MASNNVLRRLAVKGVVTALSCAACGAASAAPLGLQVAAGVADHHAKKIDLGVAWDPGLTWWQIGDWHFSLIGEFHVAWWHNNEGDVHENIGEMGVTPMIRFIKGTGSLRPFVEVGAGIRVLTSPQIGSDFTLGTAFQFTETAGIGVQFGSRQQYLAGYRFQHVSNGGIKEPNPGINFSQLYLQYNF